MIAPGTRFPKSHLVAIEEVSGADADKGAGTGAWCWVKCDCGSRSLKRSRHLNAGLVKTCGYACPLRFSRGSGSSEGAKRGWVTRRRNLAEAT